MDRSVHSISWEEPQQLLADFRLQECFAVGEVSGEGCDISLQTKVTNPSDGAVINSKPQNEDMPSKGLQKSLSDLDLAQLKNQSSP